MLGEIASLQPIIHQRDGAGITECQVKRGWHEAGKMAQKVKGLAAHMWQPESNFQGQQWEKQLPKIVLGPSQAQALTHVDTHTNKRLNILKHKMA